MDRFSIALNLLFVGWSLWSQIYKYTHGKAMLWYLWTSWNWKEADDDDGEDGPRAPDGSKLRRTSTVDLHLGEMSAVELL
jgi:hypothetical protein